MAINPLTVFDGALIGNLGKTTGTALQRTQSFDKMLNTAEVNRGAAPDRSGQALEMVQRARMQMMQGLFELLEGSNDGSPLDKPGNAFSLYQQSQAASQKLDTPVLQQPAFQAKLTRPAPSAREEIEQMIDRVARHVSLAPDLIRSVVTTESNFRPDATSPAGAQGLMQLMPETAKELGVADSLDPLQNLLGGSRYLKQLLDKYDGDLDHALAAYNWGPGNVDRKGLENMPRETRDYLVRVKTQLAG